MGENVCICFNLRLGQAFLRRAGFLPVRQRTCSWWEVWENLLDWLVALLYNWDIKCIFFIFCKACIHEYHWQKELIRSWVMLWYSSCSTTNVTALVPAASWSYYRALSARKYTENLTYMSSPMGLFPPFLNPWMLYTEQGYDYVFVKVVTVAVYHRFSVVASVCKLKRKHRRRRGVT